MGNDSSLFKGIDEVLDVVDRAVSSNDYSNMSRQIKDIVQTNTQEFLKKGAQKISGKQYAGGHMEGSGNAFEGTYQSPQARKWAAMQAARQKQAEARRQINAAKMQKNAARAQAKAAYQAAQKAYTAETPFFKAVKGGIGQKFLFWTGLVGAIFFGTMTLTMLFSSLVSGDALFGGVAAGFFAVLAAGAGIMSYFGGKNGGLLERFAKYRSVIERDLYADIKELSAQTGIPEKVVRKDLKKLMKGGMFKQGHFDKNETCLIASDELYAQYLKTEEYAAALREQKKKTEKEMQAVPAEVQAVLEKGNEYIALIKSANEAIPEPDVTEKLNRMERIVSRIFAEVKAEPALADNLNMFMDYYLPTTAKLLIAYKEMDAKPMQGETIKQAKEEIEGSLDTINDAFETLLDSFFKDKALDVSTDISVMKTIMQQEGLTPDDLAELQKRTEEHRKMETGPTLEELKKQIEAKEKESKAESKDEGDTVETEEGVLLASH